jgi:hypothetical protein
MGITVVVVRLFQCGGGGGDGSGILEPQVGLFNRTGIKA